MCVWRGIGSSKSAQLLHPALQTEEEHRLEAEAIQTMKRTLGVDTAVGVCT